MDIQTVLVGLGAAFCASWAILLIVKGLVEQTARRQQDVSVFVDVAQFVSGFIFLWLAFILHGGL